MADATHAAGWAAIRLRRLASRHALLPSTFALLFAREVVEAADICVIKPMRIHSVLISEEMLGSSIGMQTRSSSWTHKLVQVAVSRT